MKAVRVHVPGDPDVMKYEDVPDPTPKPTEALVKLEAAGVNFIDVYFRTGQYKSAMPMILGLEGSGTVVAVSENAAGIKVGDRVAYTGVSGAYAQLAAVPTDRLIKIPSEITARQAGAAMLQGITAHYLATSTYPLKRGDTCLIHAAAGGVGLLLCQIAKIRGARVIGTVGTEEKGKLAREAGADEVILYTKQEFDAEVKRITQGKGVQVVYDSVGETTFAKGLDCLAPRGMMVLFGQSSGAVKSIDPQVLNQKGSLFLTRPTIVHHISTRQDLLDRSGELFGWMSAGKVKVRIGGEFALKDVAEAHRQLEGRKTTGKLLLVA